MNRLIALKPLGTVLVDATGDGTGVTVPGVHNELCNKGFNLL